MYTSCLFPTRESEPKTYPSEMPEYFKDLNLDQIVEGATKDYSAFDIRKHYYQLLGDIETLVYRQEAMADLMRPEALAAVRSLCDTVVAVSRLLPKLASSLRGEGPMENNAMTKGAFLNAAIKYIVALQTFSETAQALSLRSNALRGFLDYIAGLFATPAWKEFLTHASRVRSAFDEAKYCLLIKNSAIRLRKYEGQEDEGEYVARLFGKFAQEEAKDYRQKLNEAAIAYHVESALLEQLVKMYPDEFRDLTELCGKHSRFLDATVERFALEAQFYLSYIAYISPVCEKGLRFCQPVFVKRDESERVTEGFDLALARSRLAAEPPVTNGFTLDPPERVIVVTGPNQGGKTTFARGLGQTHHLAMLGLFVPGTTARLQPVSKILTHFEKEEDVENGAGKLMDDLKRVKPMLESADENSLFIINEIFASTTLDDATRISRDLMKRLIAIGARAIWVTFIDELAAYGKETVSMMSTVESEESERRTFRIERRAADGLAYAMYIAKKHALTYEQLRGRIQA